MCAKKLMLFTISMLVSVFLLAPLYEISALNGSQFNAAKIIDDGVFYNPNTMTTNQIQQFLNSKVPVCDTNGTQPRGGTTRAAFGTSRGYPPPYICLKDYSMNIPSRAADQFCSGSVTGGTKSAAQIIYDVSQACGINPMVLIITLQKEQSLITDDWPWPIQYEKAMGYACPDTAPCNPEFAGLFNQLYYAARQFQRYAKQPQLFNYRAGRTSFVQFNPNAACGGTNITIQNQATAGLYNYTPYQPNASALNNLYGTGDSCSAYGNRNFWRMFHDWFGTTLSNRPFTNVNWKFENLEGGSNSLRSTRNTVGITPETITYQGKLYTFYYDSTDRDLKLATADDSGWSYSVIDGNQTTNGKVTSDVGREITATVFDDMLHIYYYDATAGSLRHAWFTPANGWSYETLDGTPGSVSKRSANVGMSNSVVSYGDEMHVFYYDNTNGNLRHATFSAANGWNFQNLDGDWGSIARFNSNVGQNPTATSHQGSLQLFYYDVNNGNLRHAWLSEGQPWKFENLDGDWGSIARFNSNVGQDPTVVSHQGSLQLFYYDVNNGNLRHAWADSGQPWRFENLDGDWGSIARFNSNVGSHAFSYSFKNSLYVFYRDNASGVLRYAWADSEGWHFSPLEGSSFSISGLQSNTGFWPTATGFGDSLQLYYFDNDQRSLRHAWGTPYW